MCMYMYIHRLRYTPAKMHVKACTHVMMIVMMLLNGDDDDEG